MRFGPIPVARSFRSTPNRSELPPLGARLLDPRRITWVVDEVGDGVVRLRSGTVTRLATAERLRDWTRL